jgi:hypothetical protein
MSTTDQEQVTPTVEAKLSSDEVKALREKKDQLSTSIRQTVLDPKAKLPEEGSAQQLRSEHVQLTEQAETAKQEAERLTEAKLQVEPLAQECQGLEKELATARESLSEFYQPLGVAAFAAQLAGQIKDVSAQADRLALHEKINQLQQEREALTPSADAKTLEKAKTKAQQLAAAGKIKIEETKIGKLDKQIGQQLLGEQQEETVRCDETSEILNQISERRAEISEKEGKVAESTASFASSRDEVTKKLDLPPFETVAELDIQIKENNKLTASAQKQLTLLERELPERLMADEPLRSSDSELGQQVQELAEIQAQLKTAGPSLAGLWSTAKEVVVRWKRTVAVIGVLLLGLLAFAIYEESQLIKATQQQIAEAALAWEAGKKNEAVAIYRDLISKNYVRFVSAEDKETVFNRLIEYDVAHEARPEAKRLVQQAVDEKIKLSLESPAARSLLAEVEKEIEKERAAEAKRIAERPLQPDLSPGELATRFAGTWVEFCQTDLSGAFNFKDTRTTTTITFKHDPSDTLHGKYTVTFDTEFLDGTWRPLTNIQREGTWKMESCEFNEQAGGYSGEVIASSLGEDGIYRPEGVFGGRFTGMTATRIVFDKTNCVGDPSVFSRAGGIPGS